MNSSLSSCRRLTPHIRVLGATVGVVVLTASVAACDSNQPSPAPMPDGPESTVRLAAAVGPYDDAVAHLYEQVFRTTNAGLAKVRDVDVDHSLGSAQQAFDSVRSGENNVVLVCMGDLLTSLNKARADVIIQDMKDSVAKGEKPGDQSGRVRAEIAAALPSDLAITNPSMAMCTPKNAPNPALATSQDEVSLPENIIPVYLKPSMSVPDREALNWVSGAVTTSDVSNLQQNTKSEPANKVARNFLKKKGLVFKYENQ